LSFAKSVFNLPYDSPEEGLMKKVLVTLALLFLPLLLTACNTLQGMGEDMKQGGQALDRAVK
jgi:entericidin B